MRKFFTIFLLFVINHLTSQTTLVSWNFADSNTTADGGIAANSSSMITTNSSGTISYPGTISGTCSSGYILNSGWDSGSGIKFWQFSFTSTSYSTISISFAARSSGTGPRDFKVTYDIGGGYSDVPSSTFSIPNTTCSNFGTFTLPAETNNQSVVTIRILMTSNTSQNAGTVASGGTNGFDNILVSAATVLPINIKHFDLTDK